MSFMSRHTDPLTDDQLRRFAPSVFAEAAHESRSERYIYIPTATILAGLRREGFEPVSARQSRTREESRREFTKHMIRMRHRSLRDLKLDETFPEIVLVNSHDGTSAYQVMGGLFRLACLNGMVVSEGQCKTVKVPHKGNIMERVIEGSYQVLEHSANALHAASDWRGIDLNRDEQMAFAEAAHVIRFGDADGNVSTPIQPAQLLEVRRSADRGNDLWRVFNRTQEAVIRGGLSAVNPETRRRTTTKAVNGISEDLRLNKALFLLSERMAALKAA
jgi:Domain of unknown function (DUF932)